MKVIGLSEYPSEYFEGFERIRQKYIELIPCSDCNGTGWYDVDHSRYDEDCNFFNECWSCIGRGVDELDWAYSYEIVKEIQELKRGLSLSTELEDTKLQSMTYPIQLDSF